MVRQKFKKIPLTELPKFINKPIHLDWAYHGTVWILDRIDGDYIECHTPKTNKKMRTKASGAMYVRQYEPPDWDKL